MGWKWREKSEVLLSDSEALISHVGGCMTMGERDKGRERETRGRTASSDNQHLSVGL